MELRLFARVFAWWMREGRRRRGSEKFSKATSIARTQEVDGRELLHLWRVGCSFGTLFLTAGFESWAVSSRCLARGGELPSGNMGVWLSTVLTKVNKQLPASLEPGLSTLGLIFFLPLKSLMESCRTKKISRSWEKADMAKSLSDYQIPLKPMNLWRPRCLQSQPQPLFQAQQSGAAMIVLPLCAGLWFLLENSGSFLGLQQPM